MGQHASHPLERPTTSISVYESAPEYSEPSFKTCNAATDFGWTPSGVVRTLYEVDPDPEPRPSPDYTLALPKYQYTEELMQEAKLQFSTCRGLFWELAMLKLRDHFLHPVDLTEAEFVDFISVLDLDAWLDRHRPKFIYRVIRRRATAKQALKDAGISPVELGGIEMFELMNDAERANFITEYKSRQQDLAAELYEAANEGIISGSTTPVELEELELLEDFAKIKAMEDFDFENLDELKLDGSEPSTLLATDASIWSAREQRDSQSHSVEPQYQPLPSPLKKRSILGSFGAAFRAHRPHESSGSSGPATTARKSLNISQKLSRSVQSIRLVLGQKRRAFKRAAIGGDLYVKSHAG